MSLTASLTRAPSDLEVQYETVHRCRNCIDGLRLRVDFPGRLSDRAIGAFASAVLQYRLLVSVLSPPTYPMLASVCYCLRECTLKCRLLQNCDGPVANLSWTFHGHARQFVVTASVARPRPLSAAISNVSSVVPSQQITPRAFGVYRSWCTIDFAFQVSYNARLIMSTSDIQCCGVCLVHNPSLFLYQ